MTSEKDLEQYRNYARQISSSSDPDYIEELTYEIKKNAEATAKENMTYYKVDEFKRSLHNYLLIKEKELEQK